ncbi:MAG: diguanylate cyclase [Synechococcus sp.]|nr:diguanylate cyclase [Synechococcus sp.]
MSATKILIVEDELLIARTLSKKLQKMGYEVSGIVSSAEAALKSLAGDFPDLILMDIVIKGEKDGIQAAAEIYQTYDLPIIYLTAYADDATLQRAEETGCYGYILKPYLEKELYATIRMALKKHDQTKSLKQDGIVDSLTGLFNRRHMDQCLQEELERSVRNKSCFCFMLIDIDHFKSFNDLFGHLAGDVVLQRVAALIKDGMRRYDTVFRYGGEEIAVICPESAIEDIQIRADALRLRIGREEITYQSSGLPPVTVSVGIAAYPNHGNSLIEKADKALYEAKNQGRNQVVIAK